MTIRSRLGLFAAVAIALVAGMGAMLHHEARRGERLRALSEELQGQAHQYPRLRRDASLLLDALTEARERGEAPAPLLVEHTRRLDADLARLQAVAGEWEEAHRAETRGARLSPLLALLIPLASLGLMLLLLVRLLGPLRRALQELTAAVTRLGLGELADELPVRGQDEFSALARAFNHMIRAFRETLRETQRLMLEQAEAAERELSSYNALLEEAVRQRTAELQATNLKLTDSLQQLKAAQTQLLASDRLAAMGRLAAGVGHEINNPLAFVLSNLNYVHQEFQEHEAPSREQLLDALTDARDGAERIRVIVQDLKTLSREADLGCGPVEVAEVVRSAAKLAGHELRHRARLVVECEDVPPVQGNGARIGQVFLNLFINAAHAIPSGQVERNEVRVVARRAPPDRVAIEVRDTGCGIPPEDLERIFDPFFTTKPVGSGTGLGLSVCRGIVSSLGGTLTVESELGRGTTFRITLPAAEAGAHLEAKPPDSLPIRGRILVVDDEPQLCASLQRSMRHADVVVLTSAHQALERFQTDAPYDYVLCDMMMPDMTGMELYAQTRRRWPAQAERFIFMTGAASAEELRDFLTRSTHPYLEKPFTTEALRAALGMLPPASPPLDAKSLVA